MMRAVRSTRMGFLKSVNYPGASIIPLDVRALAMSLLWKSLFGDFQSVCTVNFLIINNYLVLGGLYI